MRRSISRHPILSLAGLGLTGGVVLETLVAVTGLGGHGLSAFCDKDVYTAVEVVAVALCGIRAVRRRDDRLAWGLMTLALVS